MDSFASRSHLVCFQVEARDQTTAPLPAVVPATDAHGRSRSASIGGGFDSSYSSMLEERLQLAWTSKIAFADLAGSERLTKTQATGLEMREGIGINSGELV
jgi:hypothetical protein